MAWVCAKACPDGVKTLPPSNPLSTLVHKRLNRGRCDSARPEAGIWGPGPDLPWPLEQSCVVSLNTSHVLIIVGLTSLEPIQRLDSAYFFNVRFLVL